MIGGRKYKYPQTPNSPNRRGDWLRLLVFLVFLCAAVLAVFWLGGEW